MIREFVPRWEMQEFIKSYSDITFDNFKNGVIDLTMYKEVMNEIETIAIENIKKLTMQEALASNLL